MNRIVRNALIGSAATAALVVGASVPAFATTSAAHPKTLAAIQASAKVKTSARTSKLNTAIAKVTAAKDISDADRATILGVLNGDLAGMTTVEAKIAADTTVAAAAADYKTIFTTYRVYAVAIPQARLAAGADRMTSTTIPRLTDAQSKLAAALAGPDASKSTPALQADLADMTTQLAAATAALSGISAQALAVTPDAFNANHEVLSPVRSAVKSAIADLKKAAADGHAVVGAIK